MFSPSSSTSPLMVWAPPLGSRRITDKAVARLLPQPDSPTSPSTSPRRSEKLTPSTALITPRRRKKWVCRSRTSRTVSAVIVAQSRIEAVAQPVAEQVDRQHHQGDRDARDQRHPPGIGEPATSLRDHQAPGRGRRRDAGAEERERRFGDDHHADVERDQHHEGVEHIGQDVGQHDAPAWMSASVVGSMMMLIPVGAVALNHHMTMKGHFQHLPTVRRSASSSLARSPILP